MSGRLSRRFLGRLLVLLRKSTYNRIVAQIRIDAPPVFVVGCGHSGTSLVLAILGTHSRIFAVPYESSLFLRPNVVQLRLLRFDLEAIAAGKRRWVEKTPRHIHRIGTILDLLPAAKILLIVRDGRDVACSIAARTGSLEEGIRRWVDDNEAGRPYWGSPNLHVFRYESLIEDFEGCMRGILEFLGEAYEPNLVNFHREPKRFYSDLIEKPSTAQGSAHDQLRNWQINQPLFDGRGRWRKLAVEESDRLAEIGGTLLTELGYVPGAAR